MVMKKREFGQKRILEGGTWEGRWWKMGIACLLGGGFVISTSLIHVVFLSFSLQKINES